MNEFSAAIGLIQLKKLDKMNKKRKKIAKRYYDQINLVHKMPYDESCSYHIYWMCVKNRKQFMKKMEELKIETGIHYKPIHQMTYYKNRKSLPITESIENKIISIPIHPNLSDVNVDYIIKTINELI